ncbi:hypothetical protein AM493_15850 [Flavobacterium akiainvivens]|uniref:Uncharacterized protein n=1 Tax=Flavobacterium akiainvivens TaxID=1202724 RepID=A0A0M8MKF0_9FLAO|nr:hypothetical protein [Flavobacterium akiainvivens]KOS07348.1 hypothetical protein AM493_15850 [Flavobacterium akiainvivens]SFQ46991.1 hypothetical protein SAMN05444144_105151 [Flavobacterium akiainvivens]
MAELTTHQKSGLIKFTHTALAVEAVILLVPLILSWLGLFIDIFDYYPFALFCTLMVNFILAIGFITDRPRYYLLYLLLVIGIPLTPVIVVLSIVTRQGY